jgi:hypothetical protein
VDERGAGAEADVGGVPCAEDVHVHGQLEGGVEVDQARAVHDGGQALEPGQVTLAEAEERVGDVARDRHTAGAQEGLAGGTVLLAERIEGAARRHLAEEARLGRAARPGPHQHEDLSDLRVPVEQHRERHLADEAGGAGDEDRLAAQGGGDVERRVHRERERRRGRPRQGAVRLPVPGVALAHPRFWVMTMGGW